MAELKTPLSIRTRHGYGIALVVDRDGVGVCEGTLSDMKHIVAAVNRDAENAKAVRKLREQTELTTPLAYDGDSGCISDAGGEEICLDAWANPDDMRSMVDLANLGSTHAEAVRRLTDQRDALLNACKRLVRDCPRCWGTTRGYDLPEGGCIPCEQCAPAYAAILLTDAAIAAAEGGGT